MEKIKATSEQRKLEAQLGGSVISLVGLVGATVMIIILMQLPFWVKFFIGIGGLGGALIGIVQVITFWQQYKGYVEAVNALMGIGLPSSPVNQNEQNGPAQKEYIG